MNNAPFVVSGDSGDWFLFRVFRLPALVITVCTQLSRFFVCSFWLLMCEMAKKIQALATLVTSWPQFVPHAQPLIKSLARRALIKSNYLEGESCFYWHAGVVIVWVKPNNSVTMLLLATYLPQEQS